jgi:hypothetical protein
MVSGIFSGILPDMMDDLVEVKDLRLFGVELILICID